MGAPGNVPGESNALQVQVPCIIFFTLTPLFVTIRVWARLQVRAGLGIDDWTLLLSFVSVLVTMEFRPQADINPQGMLLDCGGPDDGLRALWVRTARLQPSQRQ